MPEGPLTHSDILLRRMHAKRTISIASLDYFGAFFLFVWGLWVLSWGLDDGSLSAAAFSTLRLTFENFGFGPAHIVIGSLSVFAGFFFAIAININGRGMSWTPLVRGTACVASISFFLNVSVQVYHVQPSSTGVIAYASISAGYTALFILNLERVSIALEIIWRRLRGLAT